jgi:PIN domain nuclease of toxin-antitoxin system
VRRKAVKILLDTHVLLWALLEPNKLSVRAHELLVDPTNPILVSAASAWEISTKYRLGRLPHAAAAVRGYTTHLRTLRAEELTINSEHALKAGSFEVSHRDPFDRLLAAQSTLEKVPLVTADPVFGLFDGVEKIW